MLKSCSDENGREMNDDEKEGWLGSMLTMLERW